MTAATREEQTERLFLGISLDPSLANRLAAGIEVAPQLKARAAPKENWHVTLRFLGSTSPATRANLERRLTGASLPSPFDIRFSGWGAFPRPARASVFWLGIQDPSGGLTALVSHLESEVRAVGFAPEPREFRPHVTIARFRAPVDARDWPALLPEIDEKEHVTRFKLLRSHLGSGPPRYDAVATFDLPG